MLQIEKDLFQREICPKIATFRLFFGLQNPQKLLGIAQLQIPLKMKYFTL